MNEFLGKWKIIEMEQWDQDYVDLEEPGFIRFDKGYSGGLYSAQSMGPSTTGTQKTCHLKRSSRGTEVVNMIP